MNEQTQETQPTLHIRFEGKSSDIPLSEIDIGIASTDDQVKNAVANFLDTETSKLENYVIERHANGNFTIRPEAVFGEKTFEEGVVEIKFPEPLAPIKSVHVNGIDLADNPLPLRRVVLTIDLVTGDLPIFTIERIPPVK